MKEFSTVVNVKRVLKLKEVCETTFRNYTRLRKPAVQNVMNNLKTKRAMMNILKRLTEKRIPVLPKMIKMITLKNVIFVEQVSGEILTCKNT